MLICAVKLDDLKWVYWCICISICLHRTYAEVFATYANVQSKKTNRMWLCIDTAGHRPDWLKGCAETSLLVMESQTCTYKHCWCAQLMPSDCSPSLTASAGQTTPATAAKIFQTPPPCDDRCAGRQTVSLKWTSEELQFWHLFFLDFSSPKFFIFLADCCLEPKTSAARNPFETCCELLWLKISEGFCFVLCCDIECCSGDVNALNKTVVWSLVDGTIISSTLNLNIKPSYF